MRSDSEMRSKIFFFLSVLICVNLLLLSSCSSEPSDLRTLVPAETLVYLETNDLAAALQPIVDSKPFRSVVTKKPDFSALNGVQVAVAITGFETSEVAVTDEQAVGKVQPRFVAVADTHAWNYQAVAFAEKKLGSFVTEIYDAEPKLEKSDKHGGKYFTWSSPNVGDGRKAFALVIDSLIYFGNDESAIDKALSVRNGQADSIAKTGKVPPHVPGNLASGYVSTDGVAQIAALAGLHFASQASEEEEVQSAVAGILPQLIRGTVTDVSWSTSQTSEGIEDKWSVRMPTDVAGGFSESMAPNERIDAEILDYVGPDYESTTIYNFKTPLIAFRNLLSVAQRKSDPLTGKLLSALSEAAFEPYAVSNAEEFLAIASGGILTTRFQSSDDVVFAVTSVNDRQGIQKSFAHDIIPNVERSSVSQKFYSSNDKSYGYAVLANGKLLCGEPEIVYDSAMFAERDAQNSNRQKFSRVIESKASIVTTGKDYGQLNLLIAVLANEGHGDIQFVSTYLTETRFTKTGMERRTVSDFGFIGWMIAQLAAE